MMGLRRVGSGGFLTDDVLDDSLLGRTNVEKANAHSDLRQRVPYFAGNTHFPGSNAESQMQDGSHRKGGNRVDKGACCAEVANPNVCGARLDSIEPHLAKIWNSPRRASVGWRRFSHGVSAHVHFTDPQSKVKAITIPPLPTVLNVVIASGCQPWLCRICGLRHRRESSSCG
jgi:hypothetical protein